MSERSWGRTWRACAGGVAAVVLAGCWSMPGAVPSRRAANEVESIITTGTVASLVEAWTYASGHPGPVGSPVWSPSGVHVVAVDEDPFGTGAAYVLSLQTLRPATGEVLWRSEPGLSDVSSVVTNPVVVDDTVYWGSGVPNLYGSWQLHGYDASTGERGPQIDDVVVDTARGRTLGHWDWGFGEGGCDVSVGVTALDDPAASWTAPVYGEGGTASAACRPVPPTVGGELLYHAGWGLISEAPAPEPAFGNAIRGYTVTPPATNCVGSTAFPCPAWVTPMPGDAATPPVIGEDGTTVYTVNDLGTVYAVDASDGDVLWSAPLAGAVTAPPALADGSLFVPTGAGLAVLAAGGCGSPECAPAWTADVGDLATQPAVAGGVVFTGARDGALTALPAAGCGAPTCAPVWSTTTGSAITGGPVVANGQVYAGTADGRLVAFRPAG